MTYVSRKASPMRLSLRAMMEAIAIAALVLAAFRVKGFVAVASLALACAAFLVYRRFLEIGATRSARGLTTTWKRKIHILRNSTAIAISLVVLSDLSFMFALVTLGIISPTRTYQREHELLMHSITAMLCAVIVASILREKIWLTGDPRTSSTPLSPRGVPEEVRDSEAEQRSQIDQTEDESQ